MSTLENKVINYWLIIILIVIIIILEFSFFKFTPYLKTYSLKENDNLSLYLNDNVITRLNGKLKYDGQDYFYKIVEIYPTKVLVDGELKRQVKIELDIPKDDIMELYLELNAETNIWSYLYQKYLKGEF